MQCQCISGRQRLALARRQIAEAIKASRQELVEVIDRWAEVSRIAQFFSEAERRAADLGDGERLKLLERLRLARELIGSIDALEHFMAWRSPRGKVIRRHG